MPYPTPKFAVNDVVFMNTGSTTVWTNQPAAKTEFGGTSNKRQYVNLVGAKRVRYKCYLAAAGVAGSKAAIQYSLDAGATWKNMDGSDGTTIVGATGTIPLNPAGIIQGAWVTLPEEAKISSLLCAPWGEAGDGVADPNFSYFIMEVE